MAPGEDVANAIGRQFARVTQPPLSELSVDWGPGVEGDWRTGTGAPLPYCGDTVHAFAAVRSSPRSLRVSYVAGGKRSSFEAAIAFTPAALADDFLHRIAASQRIREGSASRAMEDEVAEALALQHQLVTQFTNYILVIDRGGQRAEDLPKVKPVETMLAAGWGGTARLRLSASHDLGASVECLSIGDDLDVGASLIPVAEIVRRVAAPSTTVEMFASNVKARFGGVSNEALPLSLNGVTELGMPQAIQLRLAYAVIDRNTTEEQAIRAFWAAFVAFLGEGIDRGLERKLKAAAKGADAALAQELLAELRSAVPA